MQCPHVDTSIQETGYMKPIKYADYIFWDRINIDGKHENVQFCKLIGRKKDVFECLNECEWKACPYYMLHREA